MNPKAGKESQIAQSAAKSYAYLLGVYLGDGCVGRTHDGYPVFRMNTIDKDFAEAVKSALQALTTHNVWIGDPKQDKRFSQSRPIYAMQCIITEELAAKLDADSCGKTDVSDVVFHMPIPQRQAFVVGLMDSEGYVAENRGSHTNRRFFMGFKVCDDWIFRFQYLLETMGIRTNKIREERPRKEHYKVPRVFTIKMQSWVDSGLRFNIKRKNDRVDIWASKPAYCERKWRPRRLSSETTRHAPVTGDDIVRSASESRRGAGKSAPAA